MTNVKVSLGYTRNMGNFESMRLDIGIEDESRSGESVQETFDRVYDKVEGLLVEKVSEAERAIKEAKAD